MYPLSTNELEVNFYFTNTRLPLFLKGPPHSLTLQQQNMQTFMKKSLARLHVLSSEVVNSIDYRPRSTTSYVILAYLLLNIFNLQCPHL